MLTHVIAPTRDFTQISNVLVWDDDLSDTAFRLLVRALALGPAKARTTTVTALAAGLSGGRISTDRARRQLGRAGLLHSTRRRGTDGRVRTESLLSNVPLTTDEARRVFDAHPEIVGRGTAGRRPEAGKRTRGAPTARASGTVPPGETPEVNTSPLPTPVPVPRSVPAPAPAPPAVPCGPTGRAQLAEAEQVLQGLRRVDQRLTLGADEARKLAPLAAEWLARGVDRAALRTALTSGLPEPVGSSAALVRWRLEHKMPAPVAESAGPAALPACDGCDRAFRPVGAERRCGGCRAGAAPRERAAQLDEGASRRVDWRTLVARVGRAVDETLPAAPACTR